MLYVFKTSTDVMVNTIDIDILFGMVVFLCGATMGALLVGWRLFLVERRNATLQAEVTAQAQAHTALKTQMDAQFKVTAQEALKSAHETFLQMADENFKKNQADGAHDLDKRHKAIEAMVQPVKEHLKALSGAVDQSQGLYKALHENLTNLNKETSKLAGALRNPAARGNWGEHILERLLENAGLIKDVHYTLQPTMNAPERVLRPDAVINLPDSLHIVIDAKAPINDFVRSLDADMGEQDYKTLQVGLAQAVKGHIGDLSKKAYWENLNSPDFVVLFLPSEHLFSAAVQADPSLLDFAADKKIVLASPILMMSLLRVVGMSWRQIELAQNAQEIAQRGEDLYKRFLTFTDHMETVGKNLQRAMNGYDSAVGSLQKSVLPAARKFKALQAAHGLKDLPDLSMVEKKPRVLELTGEDEEEKRCA